MSQTPLRGALVGCGFFAENQMHAWSEIKDVAIVAVCDLDARKAVAMSARFGGPSVYVDAATMLESEPLDFLDIATTVESHRTLVELAASAGVAAICQKPIAQSLSDADAMVAATAKAKVPFIVHENFRWQKPFREMARLIADGAIGTPHFARLSFRHSYDIFSGQPYLLREPRLAIMDVGLHLLDLIRFLIGEIDNVHCRLMRVRPDLAGEDLFLLSLRHKGGAISSIDCSFAAHRTPDPFPETYALIEGPEGSLELNYGYRLLHHRGGASTELDVEPDVPAWGAKPWHAIQDSVIAFQQHAADVIRGRAEPGPSGRDNRETLRAALAAYESAFRNSSLDINQIGGRSNAR